MSHSKFIDAEGKVIAQGGVVVRKEHSYAEFEDVQWTVNQVNNVLFGENKILKFELRRTPRNELIEDIVISWCETNPTGVTYFKCPTFWNNVDQIRVLINNKEVVDLKSPYGIRNEYRDRLWTRHNSVWEADTHWNWITGVNTAGLQDWGDGENGLWEHIEFLPGAKQEFRATLSDVLGGVFDGLPMNNIYLIEIEMRLLNQSKDYMIGDVAEAFQTIHDEITVYSRHKQLVLKQPRNFSNFTMFHHEHEVLVLNPTPLHDNAIVNPIREMTVDLHTFIPRRTNIQRIIVGYQRTTFTAGSNHRGFFANKFGGLKLTRNGDDILGTEWFYRSRRDVSYQADKYYKRHHGGVTPRNVRFGESNWGAMIPQFFIDCTAVTKSINASAGQETKVKASEGIDNHSNLILTIYGQDDLDLAPNEDLVIIVEWARFDRIAPNGQVVKIITP